MVTLPVLAGSMEIILNTATGNDKRDEGNYTSLQSSVLVLFYTPHCAGNVATWATGMRLFSLQST